MHRECWLGSLLCPQLWETQLHRAPAVPGLRWGSASPKEQMLSGTIFLPSPVGDTAITPTDVPRSVERCVPTSSCSHSHGWRSPTPRWMDRARHCLGDPAMPIVLPLLHVSLCPPVTRAQRGAGTAPQPRSVPGNGSARFPSTPWSLLGLGAGFALLAVPSCRAVGSPLVMDPNSICRKTKRLAGKQAELCQLEPEIVQEVAKGTKLGVRECQYQFRFRRWNCTSHSKYFGKILQQGKASASSASHFPKRAQPGHAPPWDSWSRVLACKPVCVCARRGLLSAPRCSHAEVLLPGHVSLCCNEAITDAPRQCGAS